jgi:hypothetical protein
VFKADESLAIIMDCFGYYEQKTKGELDDCFYRGEQYLSVKWDIGDQDA